MLTLPETLARFVEDQITSGGYPDADAVLVAAVRGLEDAAADEPEMMRRLLAKLQSGVDQLDRGEGIEVTDLDAYFDALEAKALGR